MTRRRGWCGVPNAECRARNANRERSCYQSNRFCGSIQGDMRTKSKVQSLKSRVQAAATAGQRGEGSKFKVRGSKFKVQGSKLKSRQPAAVERLSPAPVPQSSRVQGSGFKVQGSTVQFPAAVERLA